MPRAKNPDLHLVAIRLRMQDIAVARRRSRQLGIPYQHIVRRWVTEGAARPEPLDARPA